MLHGGRLGTEGQEEQVTVVTHSAIRELLLAGRDVIVDDTNLAPRSVQELRRLALLAGAEFAVVDLTGVPMQVCIERDARRAATVGEEVIRDMHSLYLAGKPHPLPQPTEPTDDKATRPEN
jgi:predicted kinase